MADLTQFDLSSAQRIARVVRAVEQEPRRARPLTFGPVQTPKPSGKHIQVVTITDGWTKDAQKTVTLANQASTPNTVMATNLLFDVPAPKDVAERECIIGKDGTAWYFVSAARQCGKAMEANELDGDNADILSNTDKILDSSGPQVLVNDRGCVRWMKLNEVRVISGAGELIEQDNGGIKYEVAKVWALSHIDPYELYSIPCDSLGPQITGGTVNLGGLGSGTVTVGGNCEGGREINVSISLNTESCPTP